MLIVSHRKPLYRKEREAESGNDYFGARYYASGMGSFLSADWSDDPDPISYADFDDPKSFNSYAYAQTMLISPAKYEMPKAAMIASAQGTTQTADSGSF